MTEAVEAVVLASEEEPKLVLNRNITARQIEKLEAELLQYPQVDCPLDHVFAPGVYVRTIHMPAGTFIIGHKHKTRHAQVVSTGKAVVMMDGVIHNVIAPCTFVSEPGVRKVLYIYEDMVWTTIHPTTETDLDKLEELLIEKSACFKEYENDMKLLQEHVGGAECHG